jgi:hypothetical protein
MAVTIPAGDIAATGVNAYVGGAVGSGQIFTGDIAVVLVVNIALDASDWNNAYAYLKTKYALP